MVKLFNFLSTMKNAKMKPFLTILVIVFFTPVNGEFPNGFQTGQNVNGEFPSAFQTGQTGQNEGKELENAVNTSPVSLTEKIRTICNREGALDPNNNLWALCNTATENMQGTKAWATGHWSIIRDWVHRKKQQVDLPHLLQWMELDNKNVINLDNFRMWKNAALGRVEMLKSQIKDMCEAENVDQRSPHLTSLCETIKENWNELGHWLVNNTARVRKWFEENSNMFKMEHFLQWLQYILNTEVNAKYTIQYW